jgi:hypothetical protein
MKTYMKLTATILEESEVSVARMPQLRIPVIVSSDSGANVSTIPVHREHDSGAS